MSSDRTALIVGYGPRLGEAIARRLGRDGFRVAIIGRDEARLAANGEALRADGIVAGWRATDVGDDAALADAVAALGAGGLDVVVHNVSVWREVSVQTLSAADLLRDLQAGAASLLTVAQAALPLMRNAGAGTIIATGSMAADQPSPGAPTLGPQKAALRALVQAMALELAPLGIHCATVTIEGAIGAAGLEPSTIAEHYAALVAETAGPREQWRTVVEVAAE